MIGLPPIACSHLPECRENAHISDSTVSEKRTSRSNGFADPSSVSHSFVHRGVSLPPLVDSISSGHHSRGERFEQAPCPLVPEVGGIGVILGLYLRVGIMAAMVGAADSVGVFFP